MHEVETVKKQPVGRLTSVEVMTLFKSSKFKQLYVHGYAHTLRSWRKQLGSTAVDVNGQSEIAIWGNFIPSDPPPIKIIHCVTCTYLIFQDQEGYPIHRIPHHTRIMEHYCTCKYLEDATGFCKKQVGSCT